MSFVKEYSLFVPLVLFLFAIALSVLQLTACDYQWYIHTLYFSYQTAAEMYK